MELQQVLGEAAPLGDGIVFVLCRPKSFAFIKIRL
jgi:hypothetical protein